MKILLFFLFIFGFGTPESVIKEAKDLIVRDGGTILYDYSMFQLPSPFLFVVGY